MSNSTKETGEGEKKQNSGHVRQISLEEFNPKGTLALTLVYFVIIVVLWFFMYFVEFAGSGPSILS